MCVGVIIIVGRALKKIDGYSTERETRRPGEIIWQGRFDELFELARAAGVDGIKLYLKFDTGLFLVGHDMAFKLCIVACL